ncbi:MAG TPA: DUF177 domain-containing protein [bacterium]|nr:DUF177 domain-containing protein [bacterium]
MKIELSSFTEKITKLDKDFEPEAIGLEEEGFVNQINLEAHVIKEETNRIWLEGQVNAHINSNCDRCLEPFVEDVSQKIRLLFDPKEKDNKQEEDTFIVTSDTLDLAKFLKDSLLLAIPSKHLCDPKCKGLCPQCGVNLNEQSCECEIESIDPRLEKLKEIKSKMED